MSGIIGSKFNHRGSGLIGSLGTDGQHLLSSGAGKKHSFETVAATGVTEAEGTAIRQDILTLALKQGIAENHTKFNLPNSAICKFEADADFNLAGSTDVGRNASEYIRPETSGQARFESDAYTSVLIHSNSTDGNTTFTDSSSNGHTISTAGNDLVEHSTDYPPAAFLGGTAIHNTDGASALTLGASGDWNFGTGDWCIEWWEYCNGAPGTWRIFSIDSGSSRFFRRTKWDQADWINFMDEGSATASEYAGGVFGSEPSEDTWVHFALVRDGTTIRVYKDGVHQTWSCEAPNSGFNGTGVPWTISDASDAVLNNDSGILNLFYSTVHGEWCTADVYFTELRVSKGTSRYPDGTTFTPNSGMVANATGTALGTTNVPTSAVTDVSGVMLLKDAYGSTTLGTDVKAYFTADNSNFTEATSYTDAGTFSTGIKMIQLGKTTCTEGSDVRWKIVWANQASESKEAYIYGIGLNY